MSASTHVIYNPVAAGGRLGGRWQQVRAQIERHLGPVHPRPTRRAGDGKAQAQAALDAGASRILSLGGDGTHHEVLNGLLANGAGHAEFGCLPYGTGGDFCRNLTGGQDLEASLRGLSQGRVTLADAGLLQIGSEAGQQRYFLNIASCGMSGEVNRLVENGSKVLGGELAFLIASLRALGSYQPALVRVHVDGKLVFEGRIYVTLACNGPIAGGGMRFAPQAKLADGLLDMVIIESRPLLASLLLAPHIYLGSHVALPGVHWLRGKEMQITPLEAGSVFLDADGESPGTLPARFQVVPRAIRLLNVLPERAGE